MSDNVIKFGKAKKKIAKKVKEKLADENRVKFGRTKAEKLRDAKAKAKAKKSIDQHKID